MRAFLALSLLTLTGCTRHNLDGIYEATSPVSNAHLIESRDYLRNRLQVMRDNETAQRELSAYIEGITDDLRYSRYERITISDRVAVFEILWKNEAGALVRTSSKGSYAVQFVLFGRLKLRRLPGGPLILDYFPALRLLDSQTLLLDQERSLKKRAKAPNKAPEPTRTAAP